MLKHSHCINVYFSGNLRLFIKTFYFTEEIIKMQTKKNSSKRNLELTDSASVCLTFITAWMTGDLS